MSPISLFPNLRRVSGRILLLAAAAGLVHAGAASTPERSPPTVRASALRAPLAFEPNRGQSDVRVQFLSRGAGYTLFLSGTDAVLSLRAASPKAADAVVRMSLVGANTDAGAEGLGELPGRSHYLVGSDRGRWTRDVPTYARVRYTGVYPGVDLVYYGNQRQLEYDFVVHPGADPRAILLAFDGIDGLEIDDRGDLVLAAGGGRVIQRAPVIYQQAGDARHRIDGRYVRKGARSVGIELAEYDIRRTLVIDPVLTYSTYLGGSGGDGAAGIAIDGSGNAYLVGSTTSADFPVLPVVGAAQPAAGGGADVFVTKLNASGSGVVYSTYLGGLGDDHGKAIAVDASGNAHVVGQTVSVNFPAVNAFQPALAGSTDGFVVKLNAAGTGIVYATYLGGSGMEDLRGVALDGSGGVYVTGSTHSVDFPASSGSYQPALKGVGDAVVAKLDPAGVGAASLVYATHLGGTDFGLSDNGFFLGPEGERATAIAVDGSGNAYVTGTTLSGDFPVVSGAQATASRFRDAFVTKLNAAGSGLVYSTFLGGTKTDEGMAIAVDSAGNAYVTGFAASLDFPTVNPLQANRGAFGADAFVTKLNAAGSAFVYSTYLGGQNDDYGLGIAVDGSGRAYVAGATLSSDFPVAAALQTFQGSFDAFVARLNAGGTALDYSTFLGGGGTDSGAGIAVDAAGAAYVAGGTDSSDFPTTAGAFETIFDDPMVAGRGDAWAAKLSIGDGVVGAAGGTVADTAGTGATFAVPAGVLTVDVNVAIDVLTAPGVSPPAGFSGTATAFVSITLEPNPSPLPSPGATIRLPLTAAMAPGTSIALFKFDPATSAVTNTGILGTVDAGGTTATFAGVTGFSVFVGYTPSAPAVTAFASFTATLEAGPRRFALKARFTLGPASDGVNPPAEPVTLEAGAASLTIAAGSFRADTKGRFKFEGVVGGTKLEAVIRSLGGGRYELVAEARSAEVGTARPVTVRLAIGNDEGSTSVVPRR